MAKLKEMSLSKNRRLRRERLREEKGFNTTPNDAPAEADRVGSSKISLNAWMGLQINAESSMTQRSIRLQYSYIQTTPNNEFFKHILFCDADVVH